MKDKVEKLLDKGKYPIWELNPVIAYIFERKAGTVYVKPNETLIKNEFVTTEAMHCGGHLDSYHINVRKRLEDLIDKAEDLGYSNILIQKLICNEFQTIRKELLSGFLKIHN